MDGFPPNKNCELQCDEKKMKGKAYHAKEGSAVMALQISVGHAGGRPNGTLLGEEGRR